LEDAGEAGGRFDKDRTGGDDVITDGVAADNDVLKKNVFVAGGAAGVDGPAGDAEGFVAVGAGEGAGDGGWAVVVGKTVAPEERESHMESAEETHGKPARDMDLTISSDEGGEIHEGKRAAKW